MFKNIFQYDQPILRWCRSRTSRAKATPPTPRWIVIWLLLCPYVLLTHASFDKTFLVSYCTDFLQHFSDFDTRWLKELSVWISNYILSGNGLKLWFSEQYFLLIWKKFEMFMTACVEYWKQESSNGLTEVK